MTLRINLLKQLCAQFAGLGKQISTKLGAKEARAPPVPLIGSAMIGSTTSTPLGRARDLRCGETTLDPLLRP